MFGTRAVVPLVLVAAVMGAVDLSPARVEAASTPACRLRTVYASSPIAGDDAVHFVDSTTSWGADEPLRGMLAHAVATGDVNGDGWTDVFVGTFADRPEEQYAVRGATHPSTDRLLLGGRDGFTPDGGFPGAKARTSGGRFVDLDGDGDLDLVVARNVRASERGRAPSEILRNDGNGRFEQATVLDRPGGARSIGLLDYDGDGRTDLFVTEDRWSGGSSVLFHNDGELRFHDATAEAGLPTDVVGMGVASADLDDDGAPDLFVAGSNRLFASDGGGRFHEVGTTDFQWPTYGTEDDPAGVAVGDLDGDGRLDLVVGQHYGSTVDRGERVPVRLYLNVGIDTANDPLFRDVTEASGLVGLPTRAPHVELADFDADGRLDVLVSAVSTAGTPVIFRNVGTTDGVPRLVAVSPPGGQQYWPAGATLDADHDGRLDVVLADFEPTRPSLVLRNTTASGHWVAFEAPPGARVELRDPTAEDRLVGVTVVAASTGYGSGDPPVAWFGVGRTRAVDVVVRTADGRTFRARGVPVDRWYRISGIGGPCAVAVSSSGRKR